MTSTIWCKIKESKYFFLKVLSLSQKLCLTSTKQMNTPLCSSPTMYWRRQSISSVVSPETPAFKIVKSSLTSSYKCAPLLHRFESLFVYGWNEHPMLWYPSVKLSPRARNCMAMSSLFAYTGTEIPACFFCHDDKSTDLLDFLD